jgi:hypothetical protein
LPCNLQNLGNDRADRGAGVDFVGGAAAQQWLNRRQVFERFRLLVGVLTVGVVGARLQPVDEYFGGRAEQDDGAELRIELNLISGTARYKADFILRLCQKCAYPVFLPDPFAIRRVDGPARFIHIGGGVAARTQFSNRGRLARAGHAGE